MLTLDKGTARRFILGKQGLWPGRRWRGLSGAAEAMRTMEYLQLDPLQVVARSQDITLHSRVLDYKPELWEEATYTQRQFFDWGGWLATRPMEELPYWRVIMARERDGHPDVDNRICKSGQDHAAAVAEMRAVLSERGVVSNRDFQMADRKRTNHYRGRKDSALALYYLWRTGEVMTHHRENFERLYALTESVAPADLMRHASDDETGRFLFLKEISFHGLSRLTRTADAFHRGVPFSDKKKIIAALLAEGEIVEIKVDGWRAVHYARSRDLPLLDELNAGRVPTAWIPIEADTTAEAVFLAPLDPLIARGRAKDLFDFEYVWAVYKPVDKRQYGYYVLPILWGDQLVGRFDSKLDRTTNTFTILGFWLENETLANDEAFTTALTRGFGKFLTFLGAENFDARGIENRPLRQRISIS